MSGKTWNERWQRLRTASAEELCDYMRRYAYARADALRYRLGWRFPVALRDSAGEVAPSFFFAGNQIPAIVELLKRRKPAQVEDILSRAERICQHRFDLLGYRDLDYGTEIDWHSDRVHGKRAPRQPFHSIRYLDFKQVGDVKVTWELNRHQHLVTLAKAYRISGDEKFTTELFDQWKHWSRENPYPNGINWTSSLEVAFRSLSWLWVYFLLKDSKVCPAGCPDLSRADWLQALGISGRHIERYLSTYFSPNTHLLGEGVALFFIGTLCPELESAADWKERGWKIVLQESERQVQGDGLHFEQSIYYHVYALDFFLHARILASRNGIAIPEEFDRTLIKMLDALCLLGRAGAPPSLGDDDGGRVFDPQRNRSEHLLDPLATGAVLFQRGDFRFVAGDIREETLWLLGPDAADRFDALPSAEPSRESVALPSSGLYLMTDPNPAQQLVIDAGRQGTGTAGHGHADALSVCINWDGQNLLIDPGTCEYVGDGPERNNFRGTSAHNTMEVDGVNQADPQNPFAWKNLPRTTVERWITGETFDYFVGSHDGYRRLSSPVVHRRHIFSLKSQFCLVRDVAEGKGEHQLEILWHLAPHLQHKKQHNGHSFVAADRGVTLLTAEGHGWAEEVGQQLWSPAYGRKETAPVAHFTTVAKLPAEFVSLFLPQKESAHGPVALARTEGSADSVHGYRYRHGDGEDYFLFGPGQQRWSLGPWTSDAEFVYLSLNPDGRRALIFCHGSRVEIGGRLIVECPEVARRCEMMERNGKTEIFSDKLVSRYLRLEDIRLELEPVLSTNSGSGTNRSGE
ncbi:MAG: alginate lyase family protein [Candidatus Sulfotelmatobacter sp.]